MPYALPCVVRICILDSSSTRRGQKQASASTSIPCRPAPQTFVDSKASLDWGLSMPLDGLIMGASEQAATGTGWAGRHHGRLGRATTARVACDDIRQCCFTVFVHSGTARAVRSRGLVCGEMRGPAFHHYASRTARPLPWRRDEPVASPARLPGRLAGPSPAPFPASRRRQSSAPPRRTRSGRTLPSRRLLPNVDEPVARFRALRAQAYAEFDSVATVPPAASRAAGRVLALRAVRGLK